MASTTPTPRRMPQQSATNTLIMTRFWHDNLKVMDASAVALCRDNNIPIVVFSIREQGNLARVLAGEGMSTIVQQKGSLNHGQRMTRPISNAG